MDELLVENWVDTDKKLYKILRLVSKKLYYEKHRK